MDIRAAALRLTVSLTLPVVLTAACGQSPQQRPTTAAACPRVVAPAGITAPLLPGTTCSLPQLDAVRFHELLRQLHGVPVVVNIWGSWCGPCLEEAPDLARVAREFQGRAQFVGIDINDLRVPAQNFIRRFRWPYPSVFDPQGAIRDALGLLGQPHTVFFDSTGKRTLVHPGPISAGQLRNELRKLAQDAAR